MRVVFFGTPQFAVPSLQALLESSHRVLAVVAQPDRPAGRGMRLHSPPIAELAREQGLPVLQPHSIRDESFLDRIRTLAPDAGVIIAYGRILPSSLLAIPRHGFINVHGSILPRYRGAAPVQRAIEHGETETGVTIMKVDQEMDHGPILGTASISIGNDEHAPSLSARLAELGAKKLLEVLDVIDGGQSTAVPQDHGRATWAPKIHKEEGRVDWSNSAAAIYNKFRAFDPWPGLFTSFEGEIVKLTDIAPGQARAPGRAGEILEVHDDGIEVCSGEGAIRIREVQRAARRPVQASEFARATGLCAGMRFE